MTVRQRTVLADGRELFYFDSAPGRDRDAPDLRTELPETSTTSQVRWDPLFHAHTVIADHRQSRIFRPPANLCPLCPTRDGMHTEVPAADYEVVVFENRFPAFAVDSAQTVPRVTTPPFQSAPGDGRCEVVCFTAQHAGSFARLTHAQARVVIDAWADRTRALSEIGSIEYVFCFENRGADIGVTLSHPHGQIYGYPFVPPRFYNAARTARRHRERTGRCLQCELLAAELGAGERIVSESAHWVAYVPFAARWPYEMRVVPRVHVPDLPALADELRDDLARVYLDVLRRFDGLFEAPVPYIADWHQAPVRQDRESWHLAAEIFTIQRAPGLLKYLAGSESGAGIWINDVTPETAAARLRAANTELQRTNP
ncbi:galactose-1-phosphate uridylyltransferase [Jatrophihabitans cynanchi]|jgi:UDPglucose--hexose-1-phosphate uridylyltransferase|uniref:Galactose-1-phosphate uridylyltransferase n=1 Tax=Jatrophihabitans cynanchi TaxID=2944128 RepID=A0ABY7JZD4_9ACTN|nr:galactose-1-phosphate uridylyltransferase [Jatrophihabitans sp. SB3-54]WAX57940.1 galactose-1-phosphate uridylyltransferase [Jatrophihabitans sp. SB3-54]